MMLAEVGLPPGADVDRASLGKLLDNWTIERYELQPDPDSLLSLVIDSGGREVHLQLYASVRHPRKGRFSPIDRLLQPRTQRSDRTSKFRSCRRSTTRPGRAITAGRILR